MIMMKSNTSKKCYQLHHGQYWIYIVRKKNKTKPFNQSNAQNKTKMLWTGSYVRVEGAQKINESLMKNTALTALYLSGDRWDVMIENNRKWNETMKEMKWTENDIGIEGAKTLSEALKVNTTLNELWLSGDRNDRLCNTIMKNK